MSEQTNLEPEITRKMIEAGVLAYSLWYARAGLDDCSHSTMVGEIWRAMEHARTVEPE